jgi:hypothetical protein
MCDTESGGNIFRKECKYSRWRKHILKEKQSNQPIDNGNVRYREWQKQIPKKELAVTWGVWGTQRGRSWKSSSPVTTGMWGTASGGNIFRQKCKVQQVAETYSERKAAKASQRWWECEVQRVLEKNSEKKQPNDIIWE